ncbi:hypothetical protein SADUNF_Sadunf11G0100100 [Salix dunnii]|uniref:Aminotransferase-like plant mobile domain-containing protein n=1 Tax=Salix dunnii TaxID=1413687 RepID=A0A835JR26_9ROSI|nr:hypothetical protein SADUNF_Sadunf11G0100100 [Salix dunnii]
MVSLNGDSKPTLRTAHLLQPTTTSMDEPKLPLDYSVSQLPSKTNWPFKFMLTGWRHRSNDWNAWVARMQSMHQAAWKVAGIDEAILNSTYDVHKYYDLIFGLSEKWCANTNTFVFPWGEATITLEDVIVLGGYSVLGSPVSYSVQNREWKMIEEKLMDARTEISRGKANKPCQCTWMRKFINSGSEIEHEAFLALWLSRYVLQNSSHVIRKEALPLAIRLARGISVALAPAVLASIYRDLIQLKRAIVAGNKESKLELFSPFQLVQLWAWERFPVLQPKPNMLNFGDPRSARWHKVKILHVEDVRLALELAGLDRHLESFVHCLRVSNLSGLDYMESYFPNRVAMQFGMDQDLPGCVAPDEKRGVAWMNYRKPISDLTLYIPPRLLESDITSRYLKWWKRSVLGQQYTVSIPVQQQRSLEMCNRDTRASKEKEKGIDPDVPPGFAPKSNIKELGILVEKDKPAVVEMFTRRSFGNGPSGSRELPGQSRNYLASSKPDDTVRKMEPLPESAQKISDNVVSVEASGRVMDGAGSVTSNTVSINGSAGEANIYKLDIRVSELETRIKMLERDVAKQKTARKLGHRFE